MAAALPCRHASCKGVSPEKLDASADVDPELLRNRLTLLKLIEILPLKEEVRTKETKSAKYHLKEYFETFVFDQPSFLPTVENMYNQEASLKASMKGSPQQVASEKARMQNTMGVKEVKRLIHPDKCKNIDGSTIAFQRFNQAFPK